MSSNDQAVSHPTAWPSEDPEELAAFYGRFKLGADGLPTPAWEAAQLTTLRSPYPLRTAWDPALSIIGFRCHRLVAASLRDILRNILDRYGSLAEVRRVGMDLFGGGVQLPPDLREREAQPARLGRGDRPGSRA